MHIAPPNLQASVIWEQEGEMTEADPSHNCRGVHLFVYLLIRHKLGKEMKLSPLALEIIMKLKLMIEPIEKPYKQCENAVR